MTDSELLEAYCLKSSEEAFAFLVRRHLDLVYSTALRQVRSSEMAQDVSQAVFTDLARKAAQLRPDTFLPAWLYQVTRRTAVDLMRRESRRQSREKRALEMTDVNSGTSVWSQIEPLLDEAIESLGQRDRAAVLLRFFQNKSLREVGEILDLSEDGAQKRVSRAIDRLRHFLTRRGVLVGASGLALTLTTNVVHSAPAGLHLTISSASLISGATLQQAATTAITKTIAMNALQKSIVTLSFAAALAVGIYEAQRAARLQLRNHELESLQVPSKTQADILGKNLSDATAKLDQAQQELEQLRQETSELARLRGQVARLQKDSRELARLKGGVAHGDIDSTDTAAATWIGRAQELKQAFQRAPEKRIPEFRLLTEQDWLDAAKDKLETEEDYRRAMSRLRSTAEGKFADLIQPALSQYIQANDGKFPTDLSALQGYLKTPMDPSMLERYGVFPANAIADVGLGGKWIVTEISPVDAEFDSRLILGPSGRGSTNFKNNPLDALTPALQAFSAANAGQQPTTVSELLPYINTADQQEALQKLSQMTASIHPQ